MPWSCCGAENLDTIVACIHCRRQKEKWTTTLSRTRVFRLPVHFWIEVAVVDEDGVPCAYEPFKLWLPDGVCLEGLLDEEGVIRADEIAIPREVRDLPCRFELPNYDGADVHTWVDTPPAGALAWVALEVVDERGDPAAGEAFRLELPDGTSRDGQLGPDGTVVVEGLPPGTCRLTLPDVDADDVLVDTADVAPPPPAETAWVGFALEDDRGDPVSGEAWKLELADGSTREGTFGPDGLVLLEDLPPGTCRLTLPDVDGADLTWTSPDDVDAPPAAPLAWVTFSVQDTGDAPLAGAAWRATLADGSRREGALGADGSVALADLPAGAVALEFPDIDESDWA